MNKQEIVTVLRDLHRISGFRVSLHSSDFAEIAAYPEEPLPFCRAVNSIAEEHAACMRGDRSACIEAMNKGSTYVYRCRFGLVETVSPLYNFGTLTGFLMMGQVASTEEDAKNAVRLLFEICSIGTVPTLVPTVSEDMIRSYSRIMTVCAEYLTLSGAVSGASPSVAEQAKKFISENLQKKLLIADICTSLGCSKSTLLSAFKRKYGTTVNAYITESRLERACALLSAGEASINEIASECGFSDQSYFSKVFSASYGISPSEYRGERRK